MILTTEGWVLLGVIVFACGAMIAVWMIGRKW